MRRLFHSSELPWGWPDALAIGWGLWFTIVAFTGGHLPVLWFWYTDPAPVLAVAGAVLITPALVWLEREQRAGSAIPPEEQHLRSLRRTFLKDAKPSFRAIPAVADADQVRLGLLVDWPHYSTMALLFWQDHVTDLTPPVRPLARMVRVDEGVVEFRLLTSGERVVMAGGFFDGVPTAGQYELALRILVDYQELHPEPSWFPGFDRAALIQQHPERPKDDTTAR